MADPTPQDSDHLSAWLEQREAAFPAWVATYGPDVTWDFSPDSLPQLEQVLRQVVGSEEALYDTANREFRDGAAWYFGEVMRRGLGGHWAYDARFDKDRNFEYLDGVGPTKSMSRPVIFLEVALTESGELRRHYDDFST
jgi:hypothetical protein